MLGNFGRKIRGYDAILISLVMAATFIGMLFVYSATKSYDNQLKYVIVQAVAFILGLVFMYYVTQIDYEHLSSFWPFIIGFSLFLLVLVMFVGTGETSTGTKGWIRIGSIGIQPSELVKIGFIITLAKHLSIIEDDVNYIKNVAYLLLHLTVPVGLIMLQPDAGTAMVFVFIFIVMVFVAGIDWRYMATAFGGFVIFAVTSWFFLLSNYQRERFLVFFNPEKDPGGFGYHVMQSKIAIGSGKIFGKGIFKGIQTQLGFLPEKHTDFIFAVIGEEAGLIGCLLIVALLIGIIIRCIYIGQNAKNSIGTFICIGVAGMWLFHTFENIGMTIGLMPVTGIPLPFVSYGGSSLMTNFIALGLVVSVRMRRRTINF